MFCNKVISPFKSTQSQSNKSKVIFSLNSLKQSLTNPYKKRIEIEDIEVKYSISFHKNLWNVRRYNHYTNKLVGDDKTKKYRIDV